jgi:hypothetical protein
VIISITPIQSETEKTSNDQSHNSYIECKGENNSKGQFHYSYKKFLANTKILFRGCEDNFRTPLMKTNTLPILMHQMRISTTQVSRNKRARVGHTRVYQRDVVKRKENLHQKWICWLHVHYYVCYSINCCCKY